MAFETGEIEKVHAALRDLASRDVSGLSTDDFLEAQQQVARVMRVAQAWGARFAGETARRSRPDVPGGSLSRQQGHGNANTMVQNLTGGTAAGARNAMEAGDAFTPVEGDGGDEQSDAQADGQADGQRGGGGRRVKYPHVAGAVTLGDISVDAAGLIVAALNEFADRMAPPELSFLEAKLVDRATGRPLADVRRLITSVRAKLDAANLERKQRRQHAERYLSWKEDHDGVVTISGRLDAVTAAPIRTVLEQMVTLQYRKRRDQDPREADQRTVGQMRADSLMELCRHALGCQQMERSGVRTTVVVRMDLADLMRADGVGRIDGIDTPVAVGELRRMAGDAAFVPEVLGGDGVVLDLGRTVRSFSAAQRLALVERDGGCAKCHAPPEHCEAHHIRWWEHGGRTDLANGLMLCTRCHHDVHRQGWGIEVIANRVSFIPPPSIDPDREPQPGGLASLDIDVGALALPPESRLPSLTEEDFAMVLEWEQEAREREDAYA